MLAEWVSTEVEAKFLDALADGDFEVVNLTLPACLIGLIQRANLWGSVLPAGTSVT